MSKAQSYVKKHTPLTSRLLVLFGAYCIGRYIDNVYGLGFVDGMNNNKTRPRSPVDAGASTEQLLDELRERTAHLPHFAPRIVELSEAFATITRAHNDDGALDERRN